MRHIADRVSELQHAFWTGEISRNELLSRAAKLGVSASVLATLPTIGVTPALAAGRAASPSKSPVTFVWADNQEPTSADPHLAQDTSSFSLVRNVYEPLVEIDPATLTLIPRLATSWKVLGNTWTFKLRSGVLFHDGSKFDASAAYQSISRCLSINQGAAFLIHDIESMKVVDPGTLKITTKGPSPYLPAHLVKIGIISPAAIKQHAQGNDLAQHWLSTNAVGTGPYIMQPWQHGSRLTLTKNTHWWHPWHAGSIDTVIFDPTTDTTVRMEKLQRGTADFVAWAPLNEAVRVGKTSGFHLHVTKTFDSDPVLYLNTKKPPLDNVLVRQALQYIFDYGAVRSYYQNYASIPTGPIPADFPTGLKGLPPFRQDFAKAKSLLDQAHVSPSSIKLDFVVPAGFAEFAFGATAFQAAAQKLGITVNVITTPWAQMLAQYSSLKTSAHITDFAQSPFSLDPTSFMTSFYQTGAVYNMSKVSDPRIDRLLTMATQSFSLADQAKYMGQAQKIVHDMAACVWGCRPQTVDAVPNYVKGYVMDRTDYRWAMKFYLLSIAHH
ncbi:MAG: glutathione-binding protein [Chloroflexi bacterium]|nr:glutathione-binding protein [Chloroflexota bacterium]